MTLYGLRTTSNDKLLGGVRLMVAMVFLMTGPMKLLVPRLAQAWSAQLLAAEIPLFSMSRWTVPFVELFLGLFLAAGLYTRPAAAVCIVIMAVATYVHMVVADPSLFPLQPSEPIIPLIVTAMCVVLVVRGAGSWSLDLRARRD